MGDYPTNTGDTTQGTTLPSTSDYGHPVYNRIAGFFRNSYGRDPSRQEVTQWGTNVDDNYMDKIRASIADAAKSNTPPPSLPSGQSSDRNINDFYNASRDWANRLQQPVNNPDFQPMLDYMRSYFQKLQGPAYTPAQMDLMQTQSLQPIEDQRAAARQQVVQRLAAKGINPGSGIVEKALQEVDNSFNTQRTNTQAQFATNAINLDRQNAAQAGQVGQQIAGLQNSQQQMNEGRGIQGVNLLGQLPQLDNQLQALGMQWLNQNNPMSLVPSGLDQQNRANQNSQQYWMNLIQGLMPLLGGVK